MPIIIGNQNNQNNEIADSMARVADSIWGKGAMQASLLGAQTDAERQRAYQLSDENKRRALVQSMASGNLHDPNLRAAAIALGPDAVKALSAGNVFATAVPGADPNAVTSAQLGAMMPTEQTVGGYSRKLNLERENNIRNNDTSIRTNAATNTSQEAQNAARIASTRATEEWKDNNSLVQDRNGNYVLKRNAPGTPGLMTPQQVVGGAMSEAMAAPQPTVDRPQPTILSGPSPTAGSNGQLSPPPTMANPTPRDLTNTVVRPQPTVMGAAEKLQNMPTDFRAAAGLPTGHMEFLGPDGAHAISLDGGQTMVLDGTNQRVPVQGSGFAAVGGQTAYQDVAGERQRQHLLNSQDYAEPTPETSQAMADLYNMPPGAVVDAGNIANNIAGFTGLNNYLPGGEIGGDAQRQVQRAGIVKNQLLRTFQNSQAFGIKEQGNVGQLIQSPSLFSNPVTLSKQIPTIFNFLVDQRRQLKEKLKYATPDQIGKFGEALADNDRALRLLTNPQWGGGDAAPAAGGAPPPSAAGGAPAPITLDDGTTITRVK